MASFLVAESDDMTGVVEPLVLRASNKLEVDAGVNATTADIKETKETIRSILLNIIYSLT